MSKIGEKQIEISPEVQVSVTGKTVSIKGKEGEIILQIPQKIDVKAAGSIVNVKRNSEEKQVKSMHGLYRTLIANAIKGVIEPWKKRLEVVGTGYNAKLQGEDLALKVGFSHPVIFKKTEGVKFQVEGNNKILISGVNKQLVGQIAHEIKMVQRPDVYKGKGIKYEGEKLRIKPGKKAKTAGEA